MYVITAIFKHKLDSIDEFLKLKKFLESLPIRIEQIKTLSKDRCYDFQISALEPENNEDDSVLIAKLKQQLTPESIDLSVLVDLTLQKNDELRKEKKLFCFDMDSTLIKQEVIELIASYADVEDQVEAITSRAMNGELDFKQSLHERVALLKGIDSTNIWSELKERLIFTPGDFELMKVLKAKGTKLAVLSGGFINLAEYVKETLNLDYAFANQLEVDDKGILTGNVLGEIVDGDKKAQLTLKIAEDNDIDLQRVVCVGDGSNDLKMMGAVGFGVAWNAKPIVQQQAPSKLNTEKISDILYLLGYSDEEIEKLSSS
ncbi:hypothetical protein WICMUC_004809 [Wickerhamomyces mucosus]|uniref:phosphoserine phosphatase n=1 Tax=Wickerhamomyces mucosus TaxID=1378264 RepID=A0A9P8PFZ0_9ASCO|nr:hypothetical protein WICMUC_004809 [Wickerhamomyces mucosus]